MDPNQVPLPPAEEPEAPTPAPEPEPAPQIDVETAYNVITQHEGWDPRLTRYEIQEMKRRKEELDRERRAFEEERQRQWQPPQEDTGDPYMQRIGRLERLMLEREARERKREEDAERTNRVASELNSAYTSFARQSGMTREQMEQRSAEFYDTLADLYPDPEMVQRIGADRAVRAAFRIFSQTNGHRPQMPQLNGRGPTASITMPRAAPAQTQPLDDGGPQRPGESLEDYVMRRRAWREQNNVQVQMRDGIRYSSE